MSYQKLTIVGNLGRAVELKYMSDGTPVANMNVAVNEKDKTTWFRVAVWGKQAEPCHEYLKKGSQVLVEGRLKSDEETGGPRIWTDRNGNPRSSYEMTANWVVFLSGGSQQAPEVEEEEEESEVPF